MTQLYNITWKSPHGKQVTARSITEAQVRALIEENQRHTSDWTYTVQPPLPDLQAMLDAANARITELESPEHQLRYQHLQQYEQMLAASEQRIKELEAVCREVVAAFEIKEYYDDVSFTIPYIKGLNTGYTIHVDDESDADNLYTALRHLLDTLPPSE